MPKTSGATMSLTIQQAVIRLSKKYLPGMAISYQHPKVKVHVGDGFKFLDDYKNEFDVIITDSSDPEGPAESLFQKPYFELLFGALKEGGVITTQGCMFHLLAEAKRLCHRFLRLLFIVICAQLRLPCSACSFRFPESTQFSLSRYFSFSPQDTEFLGIFSRKDQG